MAGQGEHGNAARLRLLYELGCAFAARIELDELCALVLAKCREVLDAEGASILLCDTDRGELYFPYVADEDPAVSARLLSLRFPAGQGIAGAVLQSGTPLRIDDVAADRRFYTGVDRQTGLTTRNLLCAPLRSHQGSIGVIQVLNRRDGTFDDDDLAFLDALAGSVAVAIENARLYADLKATADQLADANRTLEQKVADRTRELRQRNVDLERTLAQLNQTQAQLVAQEKLASLGALTAGIAHEIRNPLNFVTNFAQLSAELTDELGDGLRAHGGGIPAEARRDLEEVVGDLQQNVQKINEHGRRADRIVQGMLQHARPRGGAPEPCDVNGLLAENVELAYHGMRGQDSTFNLTVEADYGTAVGTVLAAPQDLSRAFLNILSNALYAAHEKKRGLESAGRLGGFTPAVAIRTRDLGDRVEVRIRDNGNGVPAAIRDKLFTPFFTTKPAGAGTGLGLSITYEIIVQQHRGELRVESEDGAYAEFVIILPRQAEA